MNNFGTIAIQENYLRKEIYIRVEKLVTWQEKVPQEGKGNNKSWSIDIDRGVEYMAARKLKDDEFWVIWKELRQIAIQ